MAGSTTAVLPNGYGPTLSGTETEVLTVNGTRQGIFFYNPSALKIAVCPTSSGGLSPIVDGAGSITLGQFGWIILDTAVCTSAWSAIAEGDAAFTVWEW